MISEVDYTKTKRKLINMLSGYESAQNGVNQNWTSFNDFIKYLNWHGWNRNDIYKLIWDIIKNHSTDLTEAVTDELGEYETSITGNCAPSSVMRLKDDPEEINELTTYVRSGIWKV